MKDYLDLVDSIRHLASHEGPLPDNVEPEIMEQEYEQGLSTPLELNKDDDNEDEDEYEEEAIDETAIYLRGG